MPDWGIDDDEVMRSLSWDPKLERIRAENGLPKHVKCGCDECAAWRSKNGHLIEGLDWNPKEKPKVKEAPKHEPTTAEHVARAIDAAAEAFKTAKPKVQPMPFGLVDPGPDLNDPDYLLALSMSPRTDWASVKLQMARIKEARKNRPNPPRTPRTSAGKKVKY